MRKKLQRVDPLWFSVPREEFFVEQHVSFGVDACCGVPLGPFDGAVDGFIVEVLIDVASIAGDPGFRGPAVDVSVEWV